MDSKETLFDKFAKIFEQKIWRVHVAHLHSVARARSSASQCFHFQQILTKIYFVIFCAEILQQVSPTPAKGY